MLKIEADQVDRLLELVQHPQDKKTVKAYLQILQETDLNKTEAAMPKNRKRRIAKQCINLILKIGKELGKHKAIDELFDHLD